jgi:hypothetical protein
MRIALDPWGSEYTSQFAAPSEADREDTPVQALDETVEERPWAPVVPCPATAPAVTAVVDGVMRSDAHAVIIDDDKQLLALFCSYAVGAVTVNRAVEVVEGRVDRLFIVGGGQSGTDVPVRAGNYNTEPLLYRSLSSRASTPEQLREALATEMRQAEAAVAEQLSGPEKLILADGNLTFIGGSSSVVGVIKTIQRMYLPPKRGAILGHLAPGQRTPLFRVRGGGRRESYDVLTCYLRLAPPRPIEHPLAGLARIEVKASLGVQKAVALLDQAAAKVFALASRAPKDPRAPQNLIPLGGLERQLRRKLGDPQLIRRGIEQTLRAML